MNGANADETLSYKYMNPIEPYLQVLKYDNGEDGYDEPTSGVVNSGMINNKLFDILYGSQGTRDKIVSMRLYDTTFDENNSNWWKNNIRDKMPQITIENYINKIISGTSHDGKIVDY